MKQENRQRILNTILYIASNTNYCGKIKLFKLLYLIDFEHFRQTGRSVTGYEYEAWKFGPVPASLMEEWEEFEFSEDLRQRVHIEPEQIFDYTRMTVRPNDGVVFDEDGFTPRQLKIMQEVTSKYRYEMSEKMIDVTHVQNGAWEKVWCDGNGSRQPIPYELSIPDDIEEDSRSFLLRSAEESMGFSTSEEAAY